MIILVKRKLALLVRVIRTIGPYTFVGEESMINEGKENPPNLGG